MTEILYIHLPNAGDLDGRNIVVISADQRRIPLIPDERAEDCKAWFKIFIPFVAFVALGTYIWLKIEGK